MPTTWSCCTKPHKEAETTRVTGRIQKRKRKRKRLFKIRLHLKPEHLNVLKQRECWSVFLPLNVNVSQVIENKQIGCRGKWPFDKYHSAVIKHPKQTFTGQPTIVYFYYYYNFLKREGGRKTNFPIIPGKQEKIYYSLVMAFCQISSKWEELFLKSTQTKPFGAQNVGDVDNLSRGKMGIWGHVESELRRVRLVSGGASLGNPWTVHFHPWVSSKVNSGDFHVTVWSIACYLPVGENPQWPLKRIKMT